MTRACASCLTPSRRIYCSRICRIRDELWLEARVKPVVGASGGADYSAIGDAVGVSRNNARDICERAIAKVRKRLTARGFDGGDVKRPLSMLAQAQDMADDHCGLPVHSPATSMRLRRKTSRAA